jgi:acetyl esterase/lipase
MISSEASKVWAAFAAAPKQIDLPLEDRRAAGEKAETITSEPEGVKYDDVPEIGGLVAIPDVPSGASVMYLFGGGYVLGSPASRRKTAGHVASASGARVFVPDYRLAPENHFPAPVDDAVAAYQHVISAGSGAERTIVMGDSSGGGLSMATVLALRDRSVALPAGVVTLSAWADLKCAGATMGSRTGVDIMATREGLLQMADWYLAGTSPSDPLASPVYADLSGLPPLLAFAGGDEILLDDSVRLVCGVGEGGSDATLFVGAGMQHVWPTWAGAMPEADAAIELIGNWIRARTA